MLRYIGSDKYEFYTEGNKIIILSTKDIDDICKEAEKDDSFAIGSKAEELKLELEEYKELYNEIIILMKEFSITKE